VDPLLPLILPLPTCPCHGLPYWVCAALRVPEIITEVLTWDQVAGWFRQRRHLLTGAPVVAVMLCEEQEDGYAALLAVFDRKTDQVLQAQRFRASRLDAELTSKRRGNKVLIVG
jgi:hypothetical protein